MPGYYISDCAAIQVLNCLLVSHSVDISKQDTVASPQIDQMVTFQAVRLTSSFL